MSTLLNRAAKASIEARLRGLRPDSARRWGRMTPHQAVCHMSDAFRMALNERPAASVTSAFSPVIKFIALRLPLPWPRGRIQTVPEAEQGRGGTPPREFEQDKGELMTLMSRFCEVAPGERCTTHPIFGPMSTDLWGRWAYRHMDHHLRQFGL